MNTSTTCMGLCLLLLPSLARAQDLPKLPLPPAERDEFSLKFPRPEALFRPETEAEARQYIVSAAKKEVAFPPEVKLEIHHETLQKPLQSIGFYGCEVCFRPLYFEDPRTERDNQSCGIFEPLRSTCLFYGNVALLPLRVICNPPWRLHCVVEP